MIQRGDTPRALTTPAGVTVADFDGQEPLEQLTYGEQGANLAFAGGSILDVLAVENLERAAVHDRGVASGGYAVASAWQIWTFDFDRGPLTSWAAVLDGPLAAVAVDGAPYFVSVDWTASWSTLWIWDAYAIEQAAYLHPRRVRELVPADLDGDGVEDWVVLDFSQLSIWRDPLRPEHCLDTWSIDGFASEIQTIAVGDYDGDGDDEVAFVTPFGEIVLLSLP